MPDLAKPYWYHPTDLISLDFNREVCEPGKKEKWPEGGVGIYVDDDFWCVAYLPLEQYRDVLIENVVAEFWPDYVGEAIYAPDHGTIGQKVYRLKNELEGQKKLYKHVHDLALSLKEENERLKAGRTDFSPRNPTRVEYTNNYFVRQYEHLLTAMAHEGTAREDLKGVCALCGLLMTDRVHSKKWIDMPLKDPAMAWAGSMTNKRHENEDEG